MLAFYFDHHVPGAIANGLQRHGVNILTAWDDGRAKQDDERLLTRATELDRILVTLDKGFHRQAKHWREIGREFTGILFGVQNRIDIGETIEYLEIFAHVMTPQEMRNRIEYLPASRPRR